MKLPRMYSEFASWWPLISAPQDYAEESQFYREKLVTAYHIQPNTMFELGCGGGNNASQWFDSGGKRPSWIRAVLPADMVEPA